jgi:hypothetical protein
MTSRIVVVQHRHIAVQPSDHNLPGYTTYAQFEYCELCQDFPTTSNGSHQVTVIDGDLT